MHINPVAVLCAAVAAWLFGAVWYLVLGSPWKAALGWAPEQIKTTKTQLPVGPMIVSFIAEVVMAAMLALFMHAFEPLARRAGHRGSRARRHGLRAPR